MATWYFIVAEIAVFGGSGSFGNLASEVKSGSIAYSLGRPYGFLGYQFAQSMGNSLPMTLTQFAIGLGMGFLGTGGLPFQGLAHVGALLLSLALAISLNFFIQACLGLSAFWFEENIAFYWIYQKLCLVFGTLMPIEFFPKAWRGFIAAAPFSSVAYAPARLACHFDAAEALRILGLQALWLAAAIALATFIFSRGVKRVSIQGG
jgi:ABC-2 type transport system permease protein